MKRGIKLALVLAFISLISVSLISLSLSESSKPKISQNVVSALEDNDQVRVIITLKDSKSKSIQELSEVIGDEKIRHKFSSSFSAEISKDDLEKLKDDSRIEKIEEVGTKQIFLQNTTVIVNAVKTWQYQIAGTNLTGAGQTVCVVDTGVNYTHPDLGGCSNNTFLAGNCSKIIAGYDYCADDVTCTTEDNDPYDKNGHGTHVSGIIAANGSIKGIAPGASIVMIKAANSSGTFWDDDIKAGIDWCVNNASLYNISVISLSLGGNSYEGYCDSQESLLASSINAAIAKNITVVVASGNNGYTTNMSSPACIQNATSVAATTKADAIASYSNRNNLTDLVAPGGDFPGTSATRINSTYLTGYEQLSGTSMAAPHVAAAIAILQQMKKLKSNMSYTPSEVLSILQSRGQQINDTAGNGLNYSRINIYNSIDITAPQYSNPSSGISYKQFFNITWTDDFNVSVVWAEFNGTVNYTVANKTGSAYILNRTFAAGNYTLRWYANDSFGNANQTDLYNVTISQASPQLNLTLNVSGILYYQSINVNNGTAINISAASSGESSIQLYRNGTLINNGTSISNSSLYAIEAYPAPVNITAVYISTQNYTASSLTYFITVENSSQAPTSYKVSPLNNTYSSNANITFTINATDATLKNATLYLWNSTNDLSLNSTSMTGIFNSTIWNYSLSEGSYIWNAYVCDNSSNCNFAGANSTLAIDLTNPTISLSIDDTSISTSESAAITCGSADTNLDNLTLYVSNSAVASSSTSSSISYTFSQSSAGTYIINCTAYDKASNTNTTSSSITVTAANGGGNGGTSGNNNNNDNGGTTTASSSESYSILYDRISADIPIEITPSSDAKDATSVSEIALESSIDAVNVNILLEPVNGSDLSGSEIIDNAYNYFSITIENLAESYLTTAEISFEVNKSWFDDNSYSVNSTKLNRYHNGEWQELNTSLAGESSAVYKFKAETPGFSTFAITSEKIIAPEILTNASAENETTAGKGAESKSLLAKWWFWLGCVVLLVIAEELISYLMKPKGNRRFHPKA